MTREPVSILLIEDNVADARLLQEMMRDTGADEHRFCLASTLADGFKALARAQFDLVVLDLGLSDSRGLETFARFHKEHPELPVVVLSGLDDEQVAVSAVQSGAQDYLVKRQLSGGALRRAIRYAVERHRAAVRELGRVRHGEEGGTIALVGAKGGVGTTTLAVNLATVLAARGSTIAVEMHARHGTFSSLLPRGPAENLSHVAAMGPARIDAGTIGPLLFRTKFGLRVLYGPQEARQEIELTPELAGTIVAALAGMADHVVMDVPANPSDAECEALRRAWHVFLVTDPEPASVNSTRVTIDVLRTAGVTGQLVGAIVINRSPLPNAPLHDQLKADLGLDIIGVVPPAAEACLAAQRTLIPAVLGQPDSVYAVTLAELTDRILARQAHAASAL